jgi:hypothetical protein
LALEKQRLLLEAANQRLEMSHHVAGLMPIFAAGDQIREGTRWIMRHPEAVAGGIALLAAMRPGVRRFIWRWSVRSFAAWRLWRERSAWFAKPAR